MQAQLSQLQQQMQQLQQQLAAEKAKQAKVNQQLEEQTKTIAKQTQDNTETALSGVKFGGAIRTNYSHTSYDDGNKNRGGELDFDIFRRNGSGDIGGVQIGREIRFFYYMHAIKSTWAG